MILTIVNVTHAQYGSADTMRIQPLVNERKIHTDSFALQLTDKLVDLQQQYDELKQLFEQKYPTYYRLKYHANHGNCFIGN